MFFPTTVLAITLFLSLPSAEAASNQNENRVRVPGGVASNDINPAFKGPMQCVVNELQQAGYPMKSIGCRGGRPSFPRSMHPRGMACDINQSDRDKTTPNIKQLVPEAKAKEIAQKCNVVDGRFWPGPPRPPNRGADAGHFQAKSVSRAVATSQRRRTHRYQ